MPSLPFDLLCCVVDHLDAYRQSDVSVHTLLALSEANTMLRQAAIRPSVWEPHYQAQYTHSCSEAEERRRAEMGADWRLMYASRQKRDREALQLLEAIMVSQPAQRVVQGKHIAANLGYDVWDALDLESLSSAPDEHTQGRFHGRSISRPFWIEAIKGVIARRHATLTWARLVGSDTPTVTMEEAFSALSGFFGVSEPSVR